MSTSTDHITTMDVNKYTTWATRELGITFLKCLNLVSMPGDERGVFCGEPVAPNTSILKIPFKSLLSCCSVNETDTPLYGLVSSLREDDFLALYLLHERFNCKERSKWYMHMNQLPSSYHSIINYTDEELEMIKGSNLYVTAISWKAQVRSDYEALLVAISDIDENFTWLTFELYLWALCTIWSRFVTVERNGIQYRCMVPYFDMLNHNPASKVGHFYKDDSLFLFTEESFSEGQELVLNYGPLSNTKLLMLYGFCIPPIIGNPYDSVDLWATMSPAAPHYEDKQRLLSDWGIMHESTPFVLRDCEEGCGVPSSLIICLRVQYAEVAGDDCLQRMGQAKDGPLSERSEGIVCQLLLSALEGMLDGYSSAIEDDLSQLQLWNLSRDCHSLDSVGSSSDGKISEAFIPPSERVKNAVIMRYSEKKVLNSVISWVEANSSNLTPSTSGAP